MSYLDASDHPELFVAHGFEEHLVDLGEVRRPSARPAASCASRYSRSRAPTA
jgi:hypothetical protein